MKLYTCQQLYDPPESWKVFETWDEANEEYESVARFYTTYLIKEYSAIELALLLQQKLFDLKGK